MNLKMDDDPYFYNGLLHSTRMTLDATSGGALMNNTHDAAYNLIEEMAKNHHSRGSVGQGVEKYTLKTGGMYEVNAFDHMNAKFYDLYKNINKLSITLTTSTPVAFVSPAKIVYEI